MIISGIMARQICSKADPLCGYGLYPQTGGEKPAGRLSNDHPEHRKRTDYDFDRLPLDHPAKAPYSLFSQGSDAVRAGIVLGLGTRLQVLQSEAVRQITRRSDIDLSLPGKQKCAYFIILDDQNSSLEFLSSLFFVFLFIKLVRYADSMPEQRCKVPVNIILDEIEQHWRDP